MGKSIGIGSVSAISGLKCIGIGSVVKKWYWCITNEHTLICFTSLCCIIFIGVFVGGPANLISSAISADLRKQVDNYL